MTRDTNHNMGRRGFLKTTAAGIGVTATGRSLAMAKDNQNTTQPTGANTNTKAENLIWRSQAPTMVYRRLGRTNYMVSRIVEGKAGDAALWRRLLQRGVNYIDTARGYGNHEANLKPFVQRYRDKLWLTSKATGIAGYNKIDAEVAQYFRNEMKRFLGESGSTLLELHKKSVAKQKTTGERPDLRTAGQRIATMYTQQLDESLSRLGTDHVDCYFVHGIEIPWIFDCLELWDAYEKVRQAGKVKHFGFSTHNHMKEVLAAAVEANDRGPWKIDLVMPAVNPGSFDNLKPELAALKKQDVGIVAMKTRGIANRPVDGRETKFKSLTEGKSYNEWERAKLWMLHLSENLIDTVVAGIESNEEMEKDLALPTVKLSAAAKRELRALVRYEIAGACHLCGDCTTVCPEHIAVTDMIRYHAYVHQYNEKEVARQLYSEAGYDPSKLCTNCGRCRGVCPSDVRITEILHELANDMA